MIIRINTVSTTPIYVQLRNEIVKGIGRGELSEGECLPTVRQLAADLGVNSMTVSKAYQTRRTGEGEPLCAQACRAGHSRMKDSEKSWRMSWSF